SELCENFFNAKHKWYRHYFLHPGWDTGNDMRRIYLSKQRLHGYFLLIAVIFIMVIGLIGSMLTYLFSGHAMLSVAQINGLSTFYNAESAVEIVTRLLTTPTITGTASRIGCSDVTGTASITNASLGGGTFTVTTTNSPPFPAYFVLNSAITST